MPGSRGQNHARLDLFTIWILSRTTGMACLPFGGFVGQGVSRIANCLWHPFPVAFAFGSFFFHFCMISPYNDPFTFVQTVLAFDWQEQLTPWPPYHLFFAWSKHPYRYSGSSTIKKNKNRYTHQNQLLFCLFPPSNMKLTYLCILAALVATIAAVPVYVTSDMSANTSTTRYRQYSLTFFHVNTNTWYVVDIRPYVWMCIWHWNTGRYEKQQTTDMTFWTVRCKSHSE